MFEECRPIFDNMVYLKEEVRLSRNQEHRENIICYQSIRTLSIAVEFFKHY